MDVQADAVQALIDRNARVSQNQEEYNAKYSELESEFERTRSEREKVAEEIKERKSRGRNIRRLMKTLGEMPGEITEFDESQWAGLVDCMTVYARDDIRFTLISGEEVKV